MRDLKPEPDLPADCCAKCQFVLTVGKAPKIDYACRRYPPSLMFQAIPIKDLAGQPGIHWETASAHSPVQPQRWCGEYKPVSHAAIMQ